MTQQAGPKGRTFDEVVKEMSMTPEEEAALEQKTFEQAQETVTPKKTPEEIAAAKEKIAGPVIADPDAPIPDWVEIPPGLKIPAGRQVIFMRMLAKHTIAPELGERQCVLWTLSDSDEKFALSRTRSESMRTLSEMSKQMIRAIDGKRVTWGGVAEQGMVTVAPFWEQIGGKYRQAIQNMYVKTHSFNQEEQADFFANCVFVATSSKV